MMENNMIKLEKILGITTLSNASMSSAPHCSNTNTYYAAGSCVVSISEGGIQEAFYKATKAVSCLTVSSDGRYLAAGERGHLPSIIIWDIHRGDQISIITGTHKHGIGCLRFSPDGRYLVSAGFKHDKQLLVWEWETQKKVSTLKLGNKVNALCFHPNGSFFVTCGDRHLKWWYCTYNDTTQELLEVTGKPASILESHKNAVFMDVKISTGEFVYCTTSTGLLCGFNETRFMDIWVQLESSASYSLALVDNKNDNNSNNHDSNNNDEDDDILSNTLTIVIVGCTEGLVRAFSGNSLHYLSTLPLPVPSVGYTERFPACLALCNIDGDRNSNNGSVQKLAAVYADKSLFMWDISNIYNVIQYKSFSYHRGCIWDVQYITSPICDDPLFPPGTFVTCSADNSIRIWTDDPKISYNNDNDYNNGKCENSELFHIIEVSQDPDGHDTDCDTLNSISQSVSSSVLTTAAGTTVPDNDPPRQVTDISTGIPDTELPDRPLTIGAPRSFAVHPNGKQLVCGDISGLLRVYDLSSMNEINSIQAHSAEILTLNYSPVVCPVGDGSWTVDFNQDKEQEETSEDDGSLVLLASAGRDKLVHIFNASQEYIPVTTLDNHSSSVTVVKFTPDGKRLLSCGGDHTMVFNSVNGSDINHIKSVQTPHGTINGLAVEATNKFAITSGQDRKLNIWNLQSGKHMRAYKNDNITAELYKSDIDPSGMYVAACAFDKTINLFDFFSGELLTQVQGHSDLITSVRFSPDGRYLISVGGDGCIIIWSLADNLVQAMQERLIELKASAEKRQRKIEDMKDNQNHYNNNGKNNNDKNDNINLTLPPPPPVMNKDSNQPPPPTGVSPRKSVHTGGGIQQQLVNKNDSDKNLNNNTNISVLTTNSSNTTINNSNNSNNNNSRWASRVDQQGGYEIFGKKISSAQSDESMRHKYTLELTSGLNLLNMNDENDDENDNNKNNNPSKLTNLSSIIEKNEKNSKNSSQYTSPKKSPIHHEEDYEYAEDFEIDSDKKINQYLSSNDNNEKNNGNNVNNENEKNNKNEKINKIKNGKIEIDENIQIESSEESGRQLESWLENMIQSENDGVVDLSKDIEDGDENDFSKSISSEFFKNKKLSNKDSEKSENRDGENKKEENVYSKINTDINDQNLDNDIGNNTLTSISSIVSNTTVNSSNNVVLEEKRKKTASAVLLMKERLRNMGVLGATKNIGPITLPIPPPTPTISTTGTTSTSITSNNEKNTSDAILMPPPPPPSLLGKYMKKNNKINIDKISMERNGDGNDDLNDSGDYGSVQQSIVFGKSPLLNAPVTHTNPSDTSTTTTTAIHTNPAAISQSLQNKIKINHHIIDNKNDTKIDNKNDKPTLPSALSTPTAHIKEDKEINKNKEEITHTDNLSFELENLNENECESESDLSPYTDKTIHIKTNNSNINNINNNTNNNNIYSKNTKNNDNNEDNDNKDDILFDQQRAIYLQQEEELRMKSVRCQEIINQLNKAKEEAAVSFDELAQLRASMSQSLSLTQNTNNNQNIGNTLHTLNTHNTQLTQNSRIYNNSNNLYNYNESVSCINDGNDANNSILPNRDKIFDNTSEILDNSVVINEADKLLSEFRSTYMSFSSSVLQSEKSNMFIKNNNAWGYDATNSNNEKMNNEKSQIDEYGNNYSRSNKYNRNNINDRNNSNNNNISSIMLNNNSHSNDSNDIIDNNNNNNIDSNVNKSSDTVTSQGLLRSLSRSKMGEEVDEKEMFSFLDKYSDRLVEMVANKVKAKETNR